MNAQLWARVTEAFSFVISHDCDDAPGALIQVCGSDEELLRHVRPLVDEHFRHLKAVASPRAVDTVDAQLPAILGGRYRVLSRLGGGNFGDVYRVSDGSHRDNDLALKVLRSSDPLALYYFKREFRSLAGIYHRNIVKLRELIFHQDQWMFTMEFVDGVDLIRFIEGHPGQMRETVLRSCLLQLAEGLAELHRRGLIHRDIKPSNALVTRDGRVVLLDFGLVRSFDRDVTQSFATFAGTPDYMAPELASGTFAAEPSDWYAFGVLLYQTLTGQLPFQGSLMEIFRRKQAEQPVPPAAIATAIPAQLNVLCLRLLERDPLKRATYGDVVQALHPGATAPARNQPRSAIIGRSVAIRLLTDAVAASQDRPALIHLCGPSGIGKTALLREFVSRMSGDPSVVVFAGRCYESEALPYQALDDLIDHIGRYFRRLPKDRVEALLPRNFPILVKMFPVLAPFLSNDARAVPDFSSSDLRTRGIAALRELLGRLRERHRIIMVIDDLQWGDLDGYLALTDLFSSPDSPPIAAVLAYRTEDFESIPALRALADDTRQLTNLAVTIVDLGRLETAECHKLAELLLTQPVEHDTLQHIAEQSCGNPFFIQEIARWINSHGAGQVLSGTFGLDDVVRSRAAELCDQSRRFLELVAVAGQPTELSILKAAGNIADPVFTRDELIANRLLRSRVVRDHEEVEIYHDRIRAALLSDMAPTCLSCRHRELAAALEAAGQDPERIAGHYEQAQDHRLCAKYAIIAAGRASDILAFNEAARYFEMALATKALDSEGARGAHRECADALARAGRGLDAAMHYISACEGANTAEQLEWNLRAAEELLYSGHVDKGLEIFGEVLHQVGIKVPEPNRLLPLKLLIRRVRLKVRGLGWRERDANDISRGALLKVDTCSAVATGLALIDILRGATLQTYSLILALDAGDPSRIARALAMEAGYRSTGGPKTEVRTRDLLRRAQELSDRTGDARAVGLIKVMSAACAWTAGRWETCYVVATETREELRERRDSVTWERDTASIFEVDALRWMGRWSVMKKILPELIEDARRRGDLYAGSILQMHGGSCAALANDDPERAQVGLAILEHWSNSGFHVEHLVKLHNQVEIALYVGEPRRAYDLISGGWPALAESFLLKVQNLNIQMRSLRARAALAAARAELPGNARTCLLNLAARESRSIVRHGATWGSAASLLIRGGAESILRRRAEASTSFAHAETLFDSWRMRMHSAVARRARGLLLGGSAGSELIATAEAELRAEGITDLERFTAVVAPGDYSA